VIASFDSFVAVYRMNFIIFLGVTLKLFLSYFHHFRAPLHQILATLLLVYYYFFCFKLRLTTFTLLHFINTLL